MSKQIEALFDEKTGKFVVHFSGVPTHDEEHRILDELLAKLQAAGYEVETEHYHDRPKLPELQEEHLPGTHTHKVGR